MKCGWDNMIDFCEIEWGMLIILFVNDMLYNLYFKEKNKNEIKLFV